MLQAVLAEEWETDIDIFTTKEDDLELVGTWAPRKTAYDLIMGVTGVTRGTLPDGVKIDIIHITDLYTLFQGFDLSFCKVWFDGSEIHIADEYAVENKTCVVAHTDLRNKEERFQKYRDRRFEIKEK